MSIELIGETEKVTRVKTGWWSFDHAFVNRAGEIGFPVKALCELYGPTGSGKSTTVYSVSGKIASTLGGSIVLADLETFDPEYATTVWVNSGFSGKVKLAEGKTDGEVLDDLVDALRKEDYTIGMLDSVGAISPIGEADGKLGEANMGQRARLMAQFCRKVVHVGRKREKPCVVFATNHVHAVIGGRGTTTSGGEVLHYMATVRIRISNKETFDDGSYIVGGKVDKNRFGYKGRNFSLFVLAGMGVHTGLTALHDCILLGLASCERTVKMDGKSYGYMNNILKGAEDAEIFAPFLQAINNYGGEGTSKESENEE